MPANETDWQQTAKAQKDVIDNLQVEVQSLRASLATVTKGEIANRLEYFEKEQKKWLANAENHKSKFNAQEEEIAKWQELYAQECQATAQLKEELITSHEQLAKFKFS